MAPQSNLLSFFSRHSKVSELNSLLANNEKPVHISGLIGSSAALTLAAIFETTGKQQHLVILPDKEMAAYFYNDLESIFGETEMDQDKKKVLFFPTSYKKPYEPENTDRAYQLSRTEVLNRFITADRKTIAVSYPEAIAEKVVTKKYISSNIVKLHVNEKVSLDFLSDLLVDFDFESVEFVAEPGQFAIRGGIVDVFSFSNEHPYRVEFFGDEVESIRTFDPVTQLSLQAMNRISLLSNVQSRNINEKRISFLEYIPQKTVVWVQDINFTRDCVENEFERATQVFGKFEIGHQHASPEELLLDGKLFLRQLLDFQTVEFGNRSVRNEASTIKFDQKPQPAFNKNFDLLLKDLLEKTSAGYHNLILSDNPKQSERLYSIFEDIQASKPEQEKVQFVPLTISLSEGFIDNTVKLLCYTDHQIFNRYHKFNLREGFGRKESISLKELYDLTPGDYVTHIDHGVGLFDGLQIIDNNGKKQEAIRLIYKNNDILYVSIHSLHRISKYVGKEGTPPVMNRLGSNSWNKLKNKTKSKVKDIARDLIKLYAKRKGSSGFQFSPDSYLQNELEASFIYEDTPDQVKTTADVKKDMEASFPMDRLVCGDVGFGKTEIAIRAAFKAVADSKQVALLVPTTILALQHSKTFGERLKDFPVTVDYINRFKSAKQQKESLEKLKEGKLDIIIGTHRLLSKDIKFKNLGLFIIDEEQKFGVAAKEKLRQISANVDTLTLTATPIPRTLQFSLMGARDLSVINTAPPNRYPVQTQLRSFGEEVISNAITYEVSRGGQVFFVHNRIQNIMDVYDMIHRFVPGVRIAIAHGQMDGAALEKVMVDFINGDYDVLLATTIIESGLDIPNANTIIINDAQNYGLSDLHQLRGRVGRSNKKAFCYLLSPPISSLTSEARKRLKAIEEYSDLGSGFSIAMRDLDIRGAGNILGAEQSGFISEIGFDMYQKILDEALNELKESEFVELFAGDKEEMNMPRECVIETDLELLIPDYYVNSITERLSLYKELDNISEDDGLQTFSQNLQDRFGPLPVETKNLIDAIRLRRMGRNAGFEKLVLKFGRMVGYFVGGQDSAFFQSATFGKVLQFIKDNPSSVEMKEKNEKLTLTFHKVKSVKKGMQLLQEIN
ncbi:MAG TPA: transcription-repair coupling factor [Bacteroidales bacterium]